LRQNSAAGVRSALVEGPTALGVAFN